MATQPPQPQAPPQQIELSQASFSRSGGKPLISSDGGQRADSASPLASGRKLGVWK
jgi:hypothetical protein